MSHTCDDLSLSRLELIVLAWLSQSKKKEQSLRDALGGFESPARVAADILERLRDRGLVAKRGKVLTEDGRRALRSAFELGRTPTWPQVLNSHLPALAFGLRPGSEQAIKVVRNADALTVAVLRAHHGVPSATTVNALCDALISEALGMPPGPHTLKKIRAHVLARRIGAQVKGGPDEIAKRSAAEAVQARSSDKESIALALGRHWLHEAADTMGMERVQPLQPLQPAQPQQVQPTTAETLLEVVRETIPRVGMDGRFGTEKVFVSAIWHGIERDGRFADLSLDRFKRWLLRANRDGWLVLARADLVGAMDAKLVAESEIEDQGATFHFVLDGRGGAEMERGRHVR